VALTRARARLYLGTVLKDGRAQAANGSLAKVLPTGFVQLFEMAGRNDPDTAWTAGSRIYPFRVCPPREDPPLSLPREAAQTARAADFKPITLDPAMRAVSVTGPAAAGTGASDADRLLGTLVHRLMQRGADPGDSPEILARRARALLLADEADVFDDANAAAARAAVTFQALAARDDVKTLLASGDLMREVPFSLRRNGVLVRGTIDCLVIRGDEVVVVEFKTGRKRPEHQAQLDVYVEAARALFAKSRVSGVLIYA
jgi:ATP-dependent exoDNAse (exonuclease V) beta subunit